MSIKQLRISPSDSADKLLKDCKGEFEYVLVAGFDKDECFVAKASEGLMAKDSLWIAESIKYHLFNGGEDENT